MYDNSRLSKKLFLNTNPLKLTIIHNYDACRNKTWTKVDKFFFNSSQGGQTVRELARNDIICL